MNILSLKNDFKNHSGLHRLLLFVIITIIGLIIQYSLHYLINLNINVNFIEEGMTIDKTIESDYSYWYDYYIMSLKMINIYFLFHIFYLQSKLIFLSNINKFKIILFIPIFIIFLSNFENLISIYS